jgi:hypothetical protein
MQSTQTAIAAPAQIEDEHNPEGPSCSPPPSLHASVLRTPGSPLRTAVSPPPSRPSPKSCRSLSVVSDAPVGRTDMSTALTQLPGSNVLTQSRLACFRRCRREHEFRYEKGIRPAGDTMPLRMGSAVHDAIDRRAKGGRRRKQSRWSSPLMTRPSSRQQLPSLRRTSRLSPPR